MLVVRLIVLFIGFHILFSWFFGMESEQAAQWTKWSMLVVLVLVAVRFVFFVFNLFGSPSSPATADDLLPGAKWNSIETMSGTEFERFVASQLHKFGWHAQISAIGADQGLDILATHGHLKVAIQCKRHLQAVGNSAVQEVHAAKSFHDANRACVVTSSSYTRSARELAAKLGVKLIHYKEISSLRGLIE